MKINKDQRAKLPLSSTEIDGTTVYNKLSVVSAPVKPNSVVNNFHLDNVITNLDTNKAGDIKLKPNATNFVGYLRCNGAEISKTTFSVLYNIIGDNFSYTVNLGGGTPYRTQYNINNTLNQDLTTWVNTTALANTNALFDVVVTLNRVYIFGRYDGNSSLTEVRVASINTDSSITTWSTAGVLPIAISNSAIIVFKNYIYLLGGSRITTTTNTYIKTIYRCKIFLDGTLGPWEQNNNLPYNVSNSRSIVTKNKVYIIGGIFNGVVSNTVMYADILDDNIDKWVEEYPLPEALANHYVAVIKDRVYVFGGLNNLGNSIRSVYYSVIDSNGSLGHWVKINDLPETMRSGCIVCSTNRVYLIGGIINGTHSNKIYSAAINQDGSLGTWSNNAVLPNSSFSSAVFITNTRLYIIGGYRNNTLSNRVDYTVIPSGRNDYMQYYGNGILTINPTTFRLPDYSFLEKNNLFAFIKH